MSLENPFTMHNGLHFKRDRKPARTVQIKMLTATCRNIAEDLDDLQSDFDTLKRNYDDEVASYQHLHERYENLIAENKNLRMALGRSVNDGNYAEAR